MRPDQAIIFTIAVGSVLFLWNLAHGYRPIVNKLSPADIENANRGSIDNSSKSQLAYLDDDRKYELGWEYDNDTITFDVNVQASGWIGLGFTRSRGMASADIVFIWVDDAGQGKISDRHAKENGYPELDKKQDYTLLSASKNDSHIHARFQRRRNTCDNEDDYALTRKAENTKLLWAYSDTEPSDEEHFAKHEATKRGLRGLFLFDPPSQEANFPPDTVTLDMLADSVPLPTDFHLMYWCQIFEMPEWPVHHLMRLEPVIQKGNEPYVHHVGVYQCTKNMSDYLEKGQKCFTGDGATVNFSSVYGCTTKFLWFWNPGMGPTDLPNGVGLPMFESPSDTYLMLELHYENLDLKPGLVDNSGLRMYLTPTPRPIEAGVMILGTPEQAPNQIIPPGQSVFRFYSHFDQCLAHLPETGVTLISALLHAHLYAKSIRMHHYRNGVQLPDYAVDENYNFYSQTFRQLSPYRHILPGDQLVLECTYNTSDTNQTIYGGYSTLDEMCDSTHYYYPRISKEFMCMSFPDPVAYVPIFGGTLVNNDTVLLPSSNETVTLNTFVRHHLDWTIPGIIEKYTDLVKNGQIAEDFYYQPLKSENSTGDQPPEQLIKLTHTGGYPKVDKPWVPEKEISDTCAASSVDSSNNETVQKPAADKNNDKTAKKAAADASNPLTVKAPLFLTEKSSAATTKTSGYWIQCAVIIAVVFLALG